MCVVALELCLGLMSQVLVGVDDRLRSHIAMHAPSCDGMPFVCNMWVDYHLYIILWDMKLGAYGASVHSG